MTTEPEVEQAALAVETTPEPEVDWKAEAEKERTQAGQLRTENERLAKLAEGVRSQDLNILRQKEQGDLLRQIAEGQRLLAEAVKTQDWTAYDTKLQEIANKQAEAQIVATNQTVLSESEQAILAIEKETGRDWVKDPAFEDARMFWRNGQYAKAVNETSRVAVKIAREETAAEKKANVRAIAEATVRTKKETEEALGKFDLGSGSEAGGGTNYIEKLKSGGALPKAEEIDRLTARYLNG